LLVKGTERAKERKEMWILRIVFLGIIITFGCAAFKTYKRQSSPIGERLIAGIFAGFWILTELVN